MQRISLALFLLAGCGSGSDPVGDGGGGSGGGTPTGGTMTATFSNLAAANTTGARFEAVNVGGYWQADFGTFRVNGITKNELRAGRVIGMQISGMKNVDLSPGNYTIEIGVKPGTANLQLDDYDSSTAGRVWGAASGSIKVETWGGLGKPAKVSGTVDMEPFAGTGSTGKFTIQFTASVDKIEI